MISNKTIKFGYGDVAVGSSSYSSTLIFRPISPAKAPGLAIEADSQNVGKPVVMVISPEDYNQLKHKLYEVINSDSKVFKFKRYTFDFSNYRKESVEVCLQHLESAVVQQLIHLAV